MLKLVGPQLVFNYLLNDPTTPDLFARIEIPSQTDVFPKVNVIGFRDGPFVQEDSSRVQAASVLATACYTINWIQKITPFTKWYLGDTLTIVPRAGKSLNAYYDRWGVHLHYDLHPVTRKVVFTADSTEAISHELGHAILDVFRPDLWGMSNTESMAYKEAFGDMISMITSLQHKGVMEYALKETNGNLRKSNIISRISEEVGNALHHFNPKDRRSPNYLRDAIEHFNYISPESLPNWRPYTELCQEPHNFSRVFTGAWYDILVSIFEQCKLQKTEIEALEQSRNRIASLTMLSLSRLKSSNNIFSTAAKAMLEIEREIGGEFLSLIRGVFVKRNILPAILL